MRTADPQQTNVGCAVAKSQKVYLAYFISTDRNNESRLKEENKKQQHCEIDSNVKLSPIFDVRYEKKNIFWTTIMCVMCMTYKLYTSIMLWV